MDKPSKVMRIEIVYIGQLWCIGKSKVNKNLIFQVNRWKGNLLLLRRYLFGVIEVYDLNVWIKWD